MNKDLKEFMNNLTLNKEISKYKDEKGNIMYLPTKNLYVGCSYLTLTEEEYKQAIFNKTIQDKEYNKTKITRPVPKNTITGKDKDKETIVDKEVEAYEIWVVANQFGYTSSFQTKEEAINFVEGIEKLVNDIL